MMIRYIRIREVKTTKRPIVHSNSTHQSLSTNVTNTLSTSNNRYNKCCTFTTDSISSTTSITATIENDTQQHHHPKIHEQRPNRFTSIYNQMQITCPELIEGYAKCVVAAQQQQSQSTTESSRSNSNNNNNNNTGSTYRMCDPEFAAVKECFRTIRRQIQQQQQQHRTTDNFVLEKI